MNSMIHGTMLNAGTPSDLELEFKYSEMRIIDASSGSSLLKYPTPCELHQELSPKGMESISI